MFFRQVLVCSFDWLRTGCEAQEWAWDGNLLLQPPHPHPHAPSTVIKGGCHHTKWDKGLPKTDWQGWRGFPCRASFNTARVSRGLRWTNGEPWEAVFTSAHALRTASFSMVVALSRYSWLEDPLPAWTLSREETSRLCTRRRSLRSLTTPLPIHVLHTWARNSGSYRVQSNWTEGSGMGFLISLQRIKGLILFPLQKTEQHWVSTLCFSETGLGHAVQGGSELIS